MTGVAAFGGFASLAIYRPQFIGLAGLALVYSFFTIYRKKYRAGKAEAKFLNFGRDEMVLSVMTLLILGMIFFPYFRGVSPEDDPRFFEGKGTIIHVDRRDGKLTLDHDMIECLMPAMTMEYDVTERGLLQNLKPGEQVRFLVSPREIDFVVVRIWREEAKKTSLVDAEGIFLLSLAPKEIQ